MEEIREGTTIIPEKKEAIDPVVFAFISIGAGITALMISPFLWAIAGDLLGYHLLIEIVCGLCAGSLLLSFISIASGIVSVVKGKRSGIAGIVLGGLAILMIVLPIFTGALPD